jgi:hypothetical protein
MARQIQNLNATEIQGLKNINQALTAYIAEVRRTFISDELKSKLGLLDAIDDLIMSNRSIEEALEYNENAKKVTTAPVFTEQIFELNEEGNLVPISKEQLEEEKEWNRKNNEEYWKKVAAKNKAAAEIAKTEERDPSLKIGQYFMSKGDLKAKVWYSCSYGVNSDNEPEYNYPEYINVYEEGGSNCLNKIMSNVINNSDSQSDYFESSRTKIFRTSVYYAEVLTMARIRLAKQYKKKEYASTEQKIWAANILDATKSQTTLKKYIATLEKEVGIYLQSNQ